MSKTLRTAALVVGAVALVATGIGAAAGVGVFGVAAGSTAAAAGAAVTMSAATAATLATVATVATIASVAAGALTIASAATAKKPPATGSPDQFAADPQGFIPYIIGRTATAGNIVFRRAWDTADKGENDRQAFVVAFSLGPIQEIESFTVDKAETAFNGSGQATGAFAGFMWQQRQLGACPEGAALGFGSGAGTPPGWDSARKLSGLAAASWTLRWDTKSKHYQNGVPAPRWIIKGVRAYDPRLDSTYPGGSGAQRANDESTWTYTTNPYLHALTYCLGRYQNGQRTIGVGARIVGIDVAAFVEGANIAYLNGWKVAGVIYSGDGKWDTLKKILQAGMGEPLQLGASISCLVNAPKVSLATISVGDVVGDASVTATQARRDRINGIVPRYRQEQNDWQFLPGTAVRVSEYETFDGGRRTKEVDYNFIPSDGAGPSGSDAQIAVACRYDIENAREFGPIVLPLKLRWIGYKPGDCVTANLPELSLASQPILLLNRDFDPAAGIPTFTARSETYDKHAYALGQTSTPPPTPGVSAEPLVPVPGSTAWAITATSIVAGNTNVPALVVEGAVDSPVAEAVIFEYRASASGLGGDEGWLGQTTLPPATTGTIISGLKPGVYYEVGVSYRRRGVVGARTLVGPALVGDLTLDFDYVTGPNRPDDGAVNTRLPNAPFGPDARTVALVLGNLDINTEGLIEQGLRQDDAQEVLDARTYVEGQEVALAFKTFRNAQTTLNSAVNTVLTLLGAKTADGTGFVIDGESVRIDPDKTLAQKFYEVGAANAAVEASVAHLDEVLVTAAGAATARSLTEVKAGGTTGEIGIIAGLTKVNPDGTTTTFSAVAIKAGVTYIIDDDTGDILATFDKEEGGVLMPSLRVGKLTVNGAVVPATISQSARVWGTAPPAGGADILLADTLPVTGCEIDIDMSEPGIIKLFATVSQAFDGEVAGSWAMAFEVDGTIIPGSYAYGHNIQEHVAVRGNFPAPTSDTFTARLRFQAEDHISISNRTLDGDGYVNTE